MSRRFALEFLESLETLEPRAPFALLRGAARGHDNRSHSYPAPHVPQQDGRSGIVREGVREEAPQRGELAGIIRQGQQANHVGELSVGHASTVRRRVTWASRGTARGTPGGGRQRRTTRACARARGLGGSFREAGARVTREGKAPASHRGPVRCLSGSLWRRPVPLSAAMVTAAVRLAAPDGKQAGFPRDFGKPGGAYGR